MNKQDKELFDKIKSASDNVSLPEELSRDNIVKQLNGVKQIAVVEPDNKKRINKKHIISAAVSVAAAAAIVIGIGAVGFGNDAPLVKSGSPNSSNVNINNNYNSSIDRTGYDSIETIVADYYKKQLSEQKKVRNYNSFSLFGKKYSNMADGSANTGSSAPSAAESVDESAQVSAESSSYGKTNLQVDGVDEGDIVKTDGKNIYVLSSDRIYVLDVSDPKNMKTLNSFPVYVSDDGTKCETQDMYLTSGKLITVVSTYKEVDTGYSDSDSYSVACYAGFDYLNTVISVYNITDPKSPVMEFSYVCDGTYVSSRISDGKFIYVGRYTIPFDYSESNEELSTETLKENCVPTEIINGRERARINANNICVRDTDDPTVYQTVASFNINDCENTFYSGAALGYCEDVYCDGEYLFVSSYDYLEKSKNIQGVDSYAVTNITAYRIDNNALTNVGSVTLPGSIIGQFSMDRYNGYFRAAVESTYKNDSASYVFVINDKLEIVSRTEAFGLGENIKSVRFVGNTAYAVTFYQTDPLFVIDLSDIKNPKVVGELKIPGFSSYLHPVGDNLVLGIGEGGDENGTDGSAEIKLFDVSDPKNPKCVDTFNMKNTYINDDHRAFISLGNGRYGVIIEQYDDVYVNISRVKALVVDINDSKISKTEYYMGPVNDDMYFTRATYIGDNLFVVGDSGVISYSLSTSERLGTYIYYDN